MKNRTSNPGASTKTWSGSCKTEAETEEWLGQKETLALTQRPFKAIPDKMKKVLTIVVTAAAMNCSPAWGQNSTPIGLWKSIYDSTGKPTALIRITEIDGELQGKIEKVFPEPGESANPICEECEGDLKNQPVVGMTILKGMRRDGSDYTGGQILDPDNGKIYRSTMKLLESGNKLIIRGYVGMPLFGRSQVWLRAQ